MNIFQMNRDERKELLGMFFPMFVEQALFQIVSLLITAIVKDSGMEAVAAVSLLSSIVGLFQQSFYSIGVGVTVIVSQLRGRGDPKTTGKAASQAIALAILTSSSVSILCNIFLNSILSLVFQNSDPMIYYYGRQYLLYELASLPLVAISSTAMAAIRGSGYAVSSLNATLINSFSYVGVAFILVRWTNLGLTGVCIAILISRVIAAIVGIVQLLRGNSELQSRGISFKIEGSIARPIFRVAIPMLLENLIFSGGKFITQSFSIVYGTNSVAANGIANNIHTLILGPGFAVNSIVSPIVGRYCGKGDTEGAKRKGNQILWLTVILMSVICILTYIFMKPLVSLMTHEIDVQEQVYEIVIGNCLTIPLLWTLGFVIPTIMRSSGDGKFASYVCTGTMLLIRITTGYLFAVVLEIGIIGIWISMFADWFVRILFFYPRFKSGKWLKFKLLE